MTLLVRTQKEAKNMDEKTYVILQNTKVIMNNYRQKRGMLKELLVKIQNENEGYVIENLKKRHSCYRAAEGLVELNPAVKWKSGICGCATCC